MKRLAVLLLVAACSSSHAAAPKPSPTPDPVAAYVAQVNALCDALLPKVLASMGGGHDGTYPVAVFTKEEPAHQAALDSFDADLAKVVVPPAAASQAAALKAYIAFADTIDAHRARAAFAGQKAFDAEITAEKAQLSDPIIAARDAAGFDQSCNAR